MTLEEEVGMSSHKPRNAGSHGSQEEARNRFSPRASGGSGALLAPPFWPSKIDFWTASLRNYIKKIYVVLNQQVCGNLL